MFNIKFRSKLFIYVTILVSIIIILGSSLFYFTAVGNLKENEMKNAKMISERISGQIDDLYNQMNIAATYLVFSPQLQNSIFSLTSGSKLSLLEDITLNKEIQKNLGMVLFFPKISNVLLYNKSKQFFYYAGLYIANEEFTRKTLAINENQNLFQNEKESLYIMPPHKNPWVENGADVLSVIKNFANSVTTKDTIIEIQVPYSHLDEIGKQNTFAKEKQIIIFDQNYNLIYPFNEPVTIIIDDEVLEIKQALQNNVTQHYSDQYGYTSIYSPYTKFHTVLISNNSSIKTQSTDYVLYTMLFCIILLTATLSILFFITKRLANPLHQLIKHINSITIDNDKKLAIQDSHFDEFKLINHSFNRMVVKLKESLTIVYEAQIREANANLAALQAQINPHFLYNALNSISAASEIYGSDVTTKMCQQLSSMMRYVTSSNQTVTLIEELNHTRNYLELMRISNDGNFNYQLHIPPEMYSTLIPKLTIQPIIENCFKHAFKECVPPWDISINCEIAPNRWKIIIKDNGIGFDESALIEFNQFVNQYKSFTSHRVYENLNIDGLGLKNIYARLAIFFENSLAFDIRNEGSGCSIVIERRIKLD